MQHCTGLYHRMKNLSTSEDIEKWIAERKKKYPTKINIEQKRAEETAKRKRGEVIQETKSISKSKYTEKLMCEKNRRVRRRRARESNAKPEPITTELYRGLRPFAGTADIYRNGNEEEKEETERIEPPAKSETILTLPDFEGNISDDEEPMNSVQLSTSSFDSPGAQPATAVQSGLISLVADYGSDSSDDEGPDQVPIKRVTTEFPLIEDSHQVPEISEAKPTNDTQVNIQNDSKCNGTRHSRINKGWTKMSQKRRPNVKTVRNTVNNKYSNGKSLMLLHRLLSRSIQHERNIICQCIKYIADNDFFL